MSTIKFSMEIPIAHLDRYLPQEDFHFCIATTAAKHPEYLKAYKEAEGFVMLDNGAYEAHAAGEKPVPLNPQELFELAEEIQPDLVWAPDAPYQHPLSINLSLEFLLLSQKAKAPWKVGYIPQARTAHQIVANILKYAGMFSWLGLSFLNDRSAIVGLLGNKICDHSRIHMLGMDDVWEMGWWPRCISSVDTSKPMKAAFKGKPLTALTKGEGLLLPTDVITDLSLADINVKEMRRYCNG